MTFSWFDATEEAVCLPAIDEGLVVDGIRGILRILFTNWASAKRFVNIVSRGCSGKLGWSTTTMGFASFTSCLFFNRADSSTWNLTSLQPYFLCARIGCLSLPKLRTLFGGSWIRGLGVEFASGVRAQNDRARDRYEGVSPRHRRESENTCVTACWTAVRTGCWKGEPTEF